MFGCACCRRGFKTQASVDKHLEIDHLWKPQKSTLTSTLTRKAPHGTTDATANPDSTEGN